MKFLKIIIAATMLVFSTSIDAQDKAANNIDDSSIALQGYSPVSYLDLGLAQKGSKNFKSTYHEVVYYFTSSEQKSTFDKNPEKYLHQYGGFCAFGVYIGAQFHPEFLSKPNHPHPLFSGFVAAALAGAAEEEPS